MYTKVHESHDKSRAMMLQSHHSRQPFQYNPRSRRTKLLARHALFNAHVARVAPKRREATFTSKSYNDALQRAFNNAKMQIFFNPDMTKFITLTYRGKNHSVEDVLYDIKQMVKREKRSHSREIKYIYVLEYQKRGSLHVHMITNDGFTVQANANGYPELTHWRQGFTNVQEIRSTADFDEKFRPYLYLFKYMRKAQRIGKSFLHASRNLRNYTESTLTPHELAQWNTLSQEHTYTSLNGKNLHFYRNYLERDILASITHNQEQQSWQKTTPYQSSTVNPKRTTHPTKHYKSKSEIGTPSFLSKQNSSLSTLNSSSLSFQARLKQSHQAKLS